MRLSLRVLFFLRVLLGHLLVGTSWGFSATISTFAPAAIKACTTASRPFWLAMTQVRPTRVVVTGAGDSVGKALFKKLVAKSGRFEPIALVRTEKSRQELLALPGVTPGQVRVGDITNRESIHGLFHGASKAVLCTSATPTRSLAFRVKNFFRSLVGRTRAPRLSELKYPKGQDPYHVDFLGQRHVIDECVRDNVEHILMLSNMGGYQANNKVNLIGQVEGDAHSGNLLKWKVTQRCSAHKCPRHAHDAHHVCHLPHCPSLTHTHPHTHPPALSTPPPPHSEQQSAT